jgi:hypothetical protein
MGVHVVKLTPATLTRLELVLPEGEEEEDGEDDEEGEEDEEDDEAGKAQLVELPHSQTPCSRPCRRAPGGWGRSSSSHSRGWACSRSLRIPWSDCAR